MFGITEIGMEFDGKFDLWTHPRNLLDYAMCSRRQA